MKRVWFGSLIALSLAVAVPAEAAKPLGAKIAKKALKANGKLKAPKKAWTAEQAKKNFKKFDLKQKFKTPSGLEITGEKYLEIANQLEAAAEEAGCELGTGKACNFLVDDNKLTAEELKGSVKKAKFELKLKKLKATKLSKKDDADETATKAKAPLGFSWDHDWGNPKKAAVYVGAEFGNSGTSRSSSCGGAAFAGVYLFNHKKEVIRLEGEVDAKGDAMNGSAELYVLGQSVWSESGTFSIEKSFEKSFGVTQSWTYWGLITLNLSAKVTAGAYLKAEISGTAKPNEYTCALTVTPGAKVSVGGEAEVAILGYGSVSAGAVGVDAELTLADIRVPVTAKASAKNANGKVTFTESIEAKLEMRYLDGSLDAYFKTNIPLNGEKVWDWDQDKFSFTIFEWEGYKVSETLFKESASQTL